MKTEEIGVESNKEMAGASVTDMVKRNRRGMGVNVIQTLMNSRIWYLLY